MSTAFQADSFQNNAFQITATTSTPVRGGDDAWEWDEKESVRTKLRKLRKKDEEFLLYIENVYETLNQAPPKFSREMRKIVEPVKTETGYTVNYPKLAASFAKVEKLAKLHEEYIKTQEEEDVITLMLLH